MGRPKKGVEVLDVVSLAATELTTEQYTRNLATVLLVEMIRANNGKILEDFARNSVKAAREMADLLGA